MPTTSEEQAQKQEDLQPQDNMMQPPAKEDAIEKINMISLAVGPGAGGLTEAHIKLQKFLKKERSEGFDENSIIRFDDDILESIDSLLDQYKRYIDLERERKEL